MKNDIYPTEEELDKIRNYDTIKDSIEEFINFLKEKWEYADCGYFTRNYSYNEIELELHTGGWSGNEDIIAALQENRLFWMFYWQKSERGGHYYFKIPMDHTKK
jgi:hypothetical protein